MTEPVVKLSDGDRVLLTTEVIATTRRHIVYRVEDGRVARLVLPISRLARNIHTRFVRRLQNEARILSSHRHSGLLHVYGTIEDETGSPGFLCETLEFYDFTQEGHPARATLGTWLLYAINVLLALDYLHVIVGLVHNDPKPCNVGFRVGPYSIPVLTDLDFVVSPGQFSSPFQTSSSEIISCTPSFCSPEQANRERVHPPSDVFSSAAHFVSIVTKHEGFKEGSSRIATLNRVCDDTIPKWQLFCSIVQDAQIILIISKALSKEPELRFQSAQEFARALWKVYWNLPPEERTRPLTTS